MTYVLLPPIPRQWRNLFLHGQLAQRQGQLLIEYVDLLRDAYQKMMLESPLQVDAFVVLPDHIHAIWTLPQGDHDYSSRWRKFKARFSHAVPLQPRMSFSKQRKRERGIWQRRFWEHMVRDQDEFAALMTYCQDDPVKHGLVSDARDWPYASFNRRAEGDGGVGRLPTLPLPPPFHTTAHSTAPQS